MDTILDQWKRERPDIDRSPMAVVGRISRLAQAIHAEQEPVFRAHGLTAGEFDVLATLRRASPDEAITPGDLAGSTMVTTGGMTKRLDSLERRGLVRRDPCDDDRRSVWIRLTAAGRRLIDRAVEAHVENEARILSGLTKKERDQLARLLRELALSVDRS